MEEEAQKNASLMALLKDATTIDKMLDLKVGALPVVDPHTGNLQGIVSYVDLLRALRDQA